MNDENESLDNLHLDIQKETVVESSPSHGPQTCGQIILPAVTLAALYHERERELPRENMPETATAFFDAASKLLESFLHCLNVNSMTSLDATKTCTCLVFHFNIYENPFANMMVLCLHMLLYKQRCH